MTPSSLRRFSGSSSGPGRLFHSIVELVTVGFAFVIQKIPG